MLWRGHKTAQKVRRRGPRETPAESREIAVKKHQCWAVRMSEIPWLLLPEAPSRGLGLDRHAAHARHRRVLTDADFAVIANVLPTIAPHTWPCPPATNVPFLPTFQGAVTPREPCHGWAGTLRSSAQSLGLRAGMRAHLSRPEGNVLTLWPHLP